MVTNIKALRAALLHRSEEIMKEVMPTLQEPYGITINQLKYAEHSATVATTLREIAQMISE